MREELFTMDPRGKSGRIPLLLSVISALIAIAMAVAIQEEFGLQRLQLSKLCVLGFGLWTTIIEIRRLRDIGWSPWWAVLFPTPANVVLIVWLFIAPGKGGPGNSDGNPVGVLLKSTDLSGQVTDSTVVPSNRLGGWWYNRNKPFRAWCFFSLSWVIGVFFVVAWVNPFGYSSWGYMDGHEWFHMYSLMILPPLLVGVGKYLYGRLVVEESAAS